MRLLELLLVKRSIFVFPAKHFITPEDERARAAADIKAELDIQVKKLLDAGKIIEAERIKRRTTYDLPLYVKLGIVVVLKIILDTLLERLLEKHQIHCFHIFLIK